ncbi:MAG TPA: heavy metal-associated domain-containing protein [Flavobacterium sp.]|nr:heavy metal-associated domain-containing protein [Flavobacterium sp.]
MNLTKSLLALSVSAMLFVSCKQTDSAPKAEGDAVASTEKAAPAKMETASFNIEGMTCAIGCAKTIEKELSGMDGVQKATVDFDKKTATVEFDANKQTPETLVKTVEATADGKTYKVSNVQSSGNHAMLFDQEKPVKKSKAKKAEKTAEAKEAKPACCSGKKHCSEGEKKA